MTVIVGLVCDDGIIVASDSQESDDDLGLKRLDVTKVYDTKHFGFTDAEIVVAGTGASAHIARAVELIAENGFAPHFTTPRSLANIVEDSMGQMKTRYGDELDLELMAAVYCKNCPLDDDREIPPVALYSVHPADENEKVGVAETVTDYAAMGSGGLFARYLLNRLHDEDHPTSSLTIDAGIKEVIYVIDEVTKVDLWCGGPTQLFCFRRKGPTWYKLERYKPSDLKQSSIAIAARDSEIKEKQRGMFLEGNKRKRR